MKEDGEEMGVPEPRELTWDVEDDGDGPRITRIRGQEVSKGVLWTPVVGVAKETRELSKEAIANVTAWLRWCEKMRKDAEEGE